MRDIKVLIVEDEAVTRTALEATVRSALRAPFVSAFESLHGALDAAARTRFDLALLDLRMEKYRGTEALAVFRERFPDVPVVVVSANEDAAVIREALEKGAAGYVPKSIGLKAIGECLKAIWETVQARA